MRGKRILLIVGGGIAAYKACELIRLIRKAGGSVRCVLTAGGAQFITPMTLAALSEQPVHTSLWDLKDEAEMGHIQLSREADLVVVCPATANLLAKMAAGIADDLATTLLLATDKRVLAAPAMNVRMWQHEATMRNVARLRADGVTILEPDEGEMACGEYGPGRLPEPEAIFAAIEDALGGAGGPLAGRHVIVTAGPTHEPIDPVRMLANRSSGKQGFAIAEALADLGARVSLIAGPVDRRRRRASTGSTSRPRARWPRRSKGPCPPMPRSWSPPSPTGGSIRASSKIKKGDGGPPTLSLVENPDILAELASSSRRPRLLIGFAAETDNVVGNAQAKRERKGCDWIVANDVSGDVMGGADNKVHLITADGVEEWETAPKAEVAARLAQRIAAALEG